ncbi:hypothetical protein ACIBJF_34230 [Streptomyces sp. NPDC050743]|uniref:hypothetical protein n=1 Tax=Streptomyces sp. NPDC050743 TaxID=3365634 RepID=UPI0037949F6D
MTSFLLGHGCDITEHQQFDDADNGMVVAVPAAPAGVRRRAPPGGRHPFGGQAELHIATRRETRHAGAEVTFA